MNTSGLNGLRILLVLVSAIGLALTAFGVTLGDTTAVEMLAGSLFFFVISFIVPPA